MATNESKLTADKITGAAKDNISMNIAELFRLSVMLNRLSSDAYAAAADMGRALDMSLPEAGKLAEEASERAIAIYEKLREVSK